MVKHCFTCSNMPGQSMAALLALLVLCSVEVQSAPRQVRSTDNVDSSHITVTTKYGGLRGRTYNVSEAMDLDVFLGVPYAQPPIGDLRLARPEPVTSWSPTTRDATTHGAKCVQRIIPQDPVLENVPFSEDCLFLDIYTTRRSDSPGPLHPVMVYLHPGGFYGGSGAKYNFTNVALQGVVVVSVSFRLDALGFLSTQDEVIPGNFALLDAVLALDFVKEIISDFGGDPTQVTLFGASSGAAMVSILSLSPLTRGKFQRAITQSGAATCPWAVFTPGRVANVPNDIAHALGQRLNCSSAITAQGNQSEELSSRDLLTCLRAVPVDVLVAESVALQYESYRGGMVFIPVTGDTFGVLPATPEELLAATDELVPIPTLQGYSSQDGSWLVPDADNDGILYPELEFIVNGLVRQHFPPTEWTDMYTKVMEMYFPEGSSALSPLQLREKLVVAATDFSMVSYIVKQARMFSKAGAATTNSVTSSASSESTNPGHFMYEFNHRPSYAVTPLWYGVGHADEKGFILGLPEGPDPFKYPNTTVEDKQVADVIVKMWTNFAKFGDPTPQPVDGVTWSRFGHSSADQNVLVIKPTPGMKQFGGDDGVVTWTGSSGLTSSEPNSATTIAEQVCSTGFVSLVFTSAVVIWQSLH